MLMAMLPYYPLRVVFKDPPFQTNRPPRIGQTSQLVHVNSDMGLYPNGIEWIEKKKSLSVLIRVIVHLHLTSHCTVFIPSVPID